MTEAEAALNYYVLFRSVFIKKMSLCSVPSESLTSLDKVCNLRERDQIVNCHNSKKKIQIDHDQASFVI